MQKDLKRVQRLIKILQAVDGTNTGRLDLADRFEVSERQIYRDVNDLIASGFPIRYSKKTGTYSYENGFSLKKVALNNDELHAMLISKEILSSIGGAFSKSMDSFFSRLITETRQGQARQKPVGILMGKAVDFKKIEDQYNLLLKAIEETRRSEIEHKGADDKFVKRELDPYRLFYSDGFWYVLGYCHLRHDIRTFALDKIRKVTVLDKYFAVRRGFDPDAYMAQCWKQYSLGEPEEVTIRFSKDAAKEIRRKQWHPSQVIKDNPDGTADLAVTISGTEEILRWVLSWGRHAEVIAPDHFRKEYIDELKAMLKAGSRKGK